MGAVRRTSDSLAQLVLSVDFHQSYGVQSVDIRSESFRRLVKVETEAQ